MTISATLRATFSARQVGTVEGGALTFDANFNSQSVFANGTAAGQADVLWTSGDRTIAASSSEDIDLAGVLVDALGNGVDMAEVVGVYVHAASANTNNVVLGDASAPVPWLGGTDATISVPPGGFLIHCAPAGAGLFTVGDSATDLLKVANSGSGTGVTYTIALLGRSA